MINPETGHARPQGVVLTQKERNLVPWALGGTFCIVNISHNFAVELHGWPGKIGLFWRVSVDFLR